MSKSISQSPLLLLAGSAFGAIFVAFGLNAMIRPQHGLSFFPFTPPPPAAQPLVDAITVVYGARDIFMGVAVWATAYWTQRKALGAILVACSAMAFVDGWVVMGLEGDGQWNHWGYAPMLTVVGSLLLGIAG